MFKMHYIHSPCPNNPEPVLWDQEWPHIVNDKCPACGYEIEPSVIEDVDEEK